MPNYRRIRVEGGTYFFTIKTESNAPLFNDVAAVRLLGVVLREMQNRWPMTIDAMVLLPDHLHTLWTLPPGDAAYPVRWGWLKKEFTRRFLAVGGAEQWRSQSRAKNRRRGVWQRRYWEHTITDEDDFAAHFDYLHWNPRKHGYVERVGDWPHSSFHRWVKSGVYPREWGSGIAPPETIRQIDNAGE